MDTYYDEDYIMCKDCFKQTHKCSGCSIYFVPWNNGEDFGLSKKMCKPCANQDWEDFYKEDVLGIRRDDPRFKMSISTLLN